MRWADLGGQRGVRHETIANGDEPRSCWVGHRPSKEGELVAREEERGGHQRRVPTGDGDARAHPQEGHLDERDAGARDDAQCEAGGTEDGEAEGGRVGPIEGAPAETW